MNVPWYFLLDLVFCLLAAAAVVWVWPRLTPAARRVTSLTAVLVMLLQVADEYFSFIVFKAWTLTEAHNHLLGWSPGGIPIEEYLFWFAFAWLLPFLYSGLAARETAAGNGVTP